MRLDAFLKIGGVSICVTPRVCLQIMLGSYNVIIACYSVTTQRTASHQHIVVTVQARIKRQNILSVMYRRSVSIA